MLTGDKLETAINIGFSCQVLDYNINIFKIEQESKQEIMNYIVSKLRQIYTHNSMGLPELSYATVVEGGSFFKIQQSRRLTECFMQLALTSKVLIACRLSPK